MPFLKVERLSKAFGQTRAVDQVSFSVNSGEVYGLLGPNGAGKTTTISMIAGLLAHDSGIVWVNDKPYSADPQAAKRVMGVVPQEIALYEELSGRENLEFWGRIAGLSSRDAKARATELLETLSLSERAGDAVRKYSGGMKRRINLGAGLMHRPKLLLLDEPTAGIDPQARAAILDYVRRLCQEGTGVLYTTHYLEEAEALCHRIGILDHGKILAEGTLSELQQKAGGDNVFAAEGNFEGANPGDWKGFLGQFRVLQHSASQLLVAASGTQDPGESLRTLLNLPVKVSNVTMKRPNLNDLFLQLTGRQLRE